MSISSGVEIQSRSLGRQRVGLLVQLLRFCIVGGLNTFVDVLAFNLLVWGFPTQDSKLLVVYNSLAYAIGAVNSFLWNKVWTFKQHSQATNDQILRFALVTCMGIFCNDAFLWLATSILTS